MKLKDAYSLEGKLWPTEIAYSKAETFANKGPSSQGYGFSCGHVWMWELDCEEGWAPKNWCFWTVVLEKTVESPLDCKEIQSVHSERDQPWDFFGRNDAKAETPILWPPHVKSWLIGKDSDAGRDWGQEEKGTTEDETAGWHHWLDGRESQWTPGVGDGQGGLACCDSWGRKESDTTEWLIWSDLKYLWITKPWKIQQPMKSKSSDRPVFFPFLLKGKFFSCVTRHSVVTSFKLKRISRAFSGGLVAKTLCSQCREPGFNPWLGNYTPHVAPKTHCSQINKELLFKKNIHFFI